MSFRGMLLKAGIDVQSGDGVQSLSLSGSATNAITLGGTNTSGVLLSGTITNGINVTGTVSIAVHFDDAFTGKIIETGTYASIASEAVTLSSSNNRPASFLFDDAGAAMTGDIRGVLSRIAVTAEHTGSLTLNALRGQVKFIGGVDFDADYADAVRGYIEIAGASDFNLNNDDHCVSGLHSRVEVGGNVSVQQGFLTGVYVELNTTGAYTVTQDADGILAGMVITITDQKNDAWGHGIYMAANAIDTGMTINACTTGIALAGAMTKGIDFSGVSGGAASASGILMGAGTSGSPATTSTADGKFVEFRCQSTATSGDNRLMYLRYDLNGTGGGECLRAFTKLTEDVGTARGAHISLDTEAAEGVSGLGVGVDAQILVGDGALPAGGTYAVLNVEWYAAGSSVDISGATKASVMRFVFGGDATGKANIEDNVNFFEITGGSAASGNMVGANNAGDATFANWVPIKIDLFGTTHYLISAQAIS